MPPKVGKATNKQPEVPGAPKRLNNPSYDAFKPWKCCNLRTLSPEEDAYETFAAEAHEPSLLRMPRGKEQTCSSRFRSSWDSRHEIHLATNILHIRRLFTPNFCLQKKNSNIMAGFPGVFKRLVWPSSLDT